MTVINDIKNFALGVIGYSGTNNDRENQFWSDLPALTTKVAKAPYVLAQSAVPASVTGTSTPTALATIQVPAGALGINGCLRVTTQWSYTNNANTKTLGVTFGGTSFMSSIQSTTNGLQYQTNIRNRGVQNSQVGYGPTAGASFTATGVVPATGAIDTTQAQSLVLLATLGTSTDTATLEGYTVEVINP